MHRGGRLWKANRHLVDPCLGALSSLEPLSHLPPFVRVVRGGYQAHPKERFRPSHRPSYLLGGGLWCLYKLSGAAAISVSAALDAGTIGDGMPQRVFGFI